MQLRHLRYFVTVAEERHFCRAAERLHISQPPLSRQIRQLESEIGFDLFIRTGHKITLTDAGVAFLARAKMILGAVGDAVEEAGRLARGERGRLSLGFMSAAMLPLLTPIIREFGGAGGAVDLNLTQLPPEELLTAVVSGQLDAGFVDVPGKRDRIEVLDTPLQIHVLRTDPMVVALPYRHPQASKREIKLRDLASEPFLMFSPSPSTGLHEEIIRMCGQAGFSPRVVKTVGQVPLMLALVAMGMGIALVPACVDKVWLDQIAFRAVDPPGEVDVSMAWRIDNRSPVLASFLREVTRPGPTSSLAAL